MRGKRLRDRAVMSAGWIETASKKRDLCCHAALP